MGSYDEFEKWLKDHYPAGLVRFQEPMRLHTTFGVGGPARYMVMPCGPDEITEVIRWCRRLELPWFVMGNGSNLLVSDHGYDGVILKLGRQYGTVCAEEDRLHAQSGAMLTRMARLAAEKGLAGLAFAAGIPGTLGGGLMMNAGAYGGELSQIVERVQVLDQEGRIRELTGEQMGFGYRTSILGKESLIALAADLRLKPGDQEKILAEMDELNRKRKEKQPLEYASAGSTFKRPEGYFAGRLIEDAGLKGFTVGDAQVSEKHCGFIINRGEATAGQIWDLCRIVQERVYGLFHVELQMEVRLLGKF